VISAGARLIGGDAIVNPGAKGEIGRLTMGNLSLVTDEEEGSIGGFVFELGPSGFDQLTVTGNLALDGSVSVSLIEDFTLGPGLSFPIIDIQGTRTGFFAGLAEGATVATLSGWDLHVSYAGGNGNDVFLYTVPNRAPRVAWLRSAQFWSGDEGAGGADRSGPLIFLVAPK
jgi:hypothetical protein